MVSAAVDASPLKARYGQAVDRESAYELLNARLAKAPAPEPAAPAPAPSSAPQPEAEPRQREEESMVEKVVTSSAFKSALRSAGTVLGREITRSIFGTARRRR
jgi:uncharacterized protein